MPTALSRMKVIHEKDKYPTFQNRFGHIFYNQEFSYYRVAAEYRFVGEQATGGPAWAIRNSGIEHFSEEQQAAIRAYFERLSLEK